MNHGNTYYNRKEGISECSTCRSRHMTEDEIAQERRNSGWNPYWAEEEAEMIMPDKNRKEQQELWGPLMGNDPALESQRLAERDLRQLQSMYPEAAKMMLPYIEETCDKMEYDGSTMYDQYPDRMTVYRLAEEIYENVRDQFPVQLPVERDEVLAMQYRPTDSDQPRRPGQPPFPGQPPYRYQPSRPDQPPQPPYGYNQPGVNWVQDLVRVLLLNEMHHRRRRKKNLFN